MKPRIGITTGGRYERDMNYPLYDAMENLPSQYVDAVRRAGGIPLMLPPGDDWPDLLDAVDAVIVTGGADVNPALYGGDVNHPAVQKPVPDRDTFDLALSAHLAKDSDMPALFICRGLQVLNVALGGTLHEHLPDALDADIHRGNDGGWTRHAVTAGAGTVLAEVMGTREAVTVSGHHQAVRDVAPGVDVTATAPDGVVEALTVTGRSDLLAVQWHPEVSAAEDRPQQRLFDWLVYRAGRGLD
ncbi:MAG: gamma-glutamyl-gamma-aminobutyrate hydrolase family protein [Chloroflexota bacterium]